MTEIITRDIIENINERKRPKEWHFSINEINLKAPNVVNEIISEAELAKIPTELLFFYEGMRYGVVDSLTFERPSWYDDKKFKLGQNFANDFYGSVNYAEMLTLLVLFSFEGNLSPLIYTRRSDTARKAAKRYLSTALRVLSWYEEDIWDKNSVAHKNIQVVRAYHKNTVKRMVNEPKEELERKSKLKNVVPTTDIKCQSLGVLQEDFKGACPFWVEATKSDVIINQAEMSFTLFGFMGLVILYPEKLGIVGVTEEELDGFVHLWRVLGHLLGIEDRFNMCQGSFDQVKRRCQQIVDKLFIPNLPNLNEEWEHMSRCMIEGVAMTIPGPTFETSSLHLFWMTGVHPTNYKRKLKWKYIVKHYVNRFIMNCIMRCAWIRVRFNTWVKNQMRLKARTLINDSDELKDLNENR